MSKMNAATVASSVHTDHRVTAAGCVFYRGEFIDSRDVSGQ